MKWNDTSRALTRLTAAALAASLAACNGNSGGSTTPAAPLSGVTKLNHIIVVYQENWSFDGLYAKFPGANGVSTGQTIAQVDKSGNPLTSVPQPLDATGNPDARFPASLPVQTYDTSRYVPATGITGDMIHRFYHEQLQIDGGKMDQFVTWSDNGGLVLSQYDATNLPEGQLAQQYTMLDNMFHSTFGGSFLNHQFLICACAPTWPNAPANYISNPNPATLSDNKVTPDGFVVNTSFSTFQPHPAGIPATNLVPPQTNPTIGDRLDKANISWAWYSGGWNNALAGNPDPNFQFHHQPFAYYASYADGTQAKATHLKDETQFFSDVSAGTLPSVVFIKPLGPDNEHPGYASLQQGQQHVANIVAAIQNSPYWNDSAIIVTYDENGGRWDHVAPPTIDRWGPGSRVPGIIISRFAKKHFVDHTQYETASVLRLIETRFNLIPLGTRDAQASGFVNAFDFSQ